MSTRGERNNNPLNIDRTLIQWDGMAVQQTDPRFIDFEKPEDCYRTASRIIREHSSSRSTIDSIVYSWAPGVENDTESYIKDVCQRTGFSRFQPLTITRVVGDPCDLLPLLRGMTWHENGEDIYDDSVIQAGMDLEITE